MPAIQFTIDHGRDVAEARDCLRAAVEQTCGRFGRLVRTTTWSADGDAVTVVGVGFRVDMRVDARQVHVAGTLPGLGNLLGGGGAPGGLVQLVRRAFERRLPGR